MLVLLVLIEPQVASLEIYFKKLLYGMMIVILRTSSYKYPLLQQCSVCRSSHIPAHVRSASHGLGQNSRHLRRFHRGARVGIVYRFLRHTRGGNRRRGTPAPLGLLRLTSVTALLLPSKHQIARQGSQERTPPPFTQIKDLSVG